MTTIATDGKTMAADTQQHGQYIDQFVLQKIQLIDKSLVGVAGNTLCAQLFFQWLWNKKSEDEPILGKTFEALIIGRVVLYMNKRLIPIEVGAPAAIGSGARYAMGAMLAGATPEEAVRIAMQLDPFTGGEVKYLTL